MNNIIQECITKRKIVEILFKFPEREFTVRELSRVSGISYATTWRFVQKSDRAGIILCRRIGHSYSCKLNKESPLADEVKKTLGIKLTPQQAVLEEFVKRARKIKNVDEIILFGSVARGTERPASDVDVALLAKNEYPKLKNKITEIADAISAKSKVVIVPVFLSHKELDENKQFQEELKKGRILFVRHKRS